MPAKPTPSKAKAGVKPVDLATNKKALLEYEIVERLEVGVSLRGTEVKSIREGRMNLRDAFARIEDGQCLLYGCDIQPYAKASWEQHDSKRIRKLLLHKSEIHKLFGSCQIKGLTLVALRMYWKGSKVKLELGVGRGKHAGDKREDLKKKAHNREVEREMARYTKRGRV
jgi:SsrA-binding protein